MLIKRALVAGCIVAVILTVGVTSAPAKKTPIEQYQANVLATDGPEGRGSSVLHINIYQWSSDDDLEIITDAVEEASENRRAYRAVPDALRTLGKAGYMFLSGGQGWPIRYAREHQVEGKRQIVLATDRPVTFTEIYAGSAVRDFDITLITLGFDDSTIGDGMVSVGTEIIWDESENGFKITNYSSQPVRLGDVRPVE